jgi:hypothetical protein
VGPWRLRAVDDVDAAAWVGDLHATANRSRLDQPPTMAASPCGSAGGVGM